MQILTNKGILSKVLGVSARCQRTALIRAPAEAVLSFKIINTGATEAFPGGHSAR